MINAPDAAVVDYPAEFHLRIICDSSENVVTLIKTVAEGYTVTQRLAASKCSVSGKYHSYGISIIFSSRSEMIGFDSAIKALPGVRMLL